MRVAEVQFQNRVIRWLFIRSVTGSSGSRYPIMQFTLQVQMIRRTMRTMEEKRAGRCKWIMMPMDTYTCTCVCSRFYQLFSEPNVIVQITDFLKDSRIATDDDSLRRIFR